MAKAPKTVYQCSECGGTSPKWQGQCPACGQWNTLVESVAEVPAALVGQLCDGARVVTGVVERGVTRLASGRVVAGVLGLSSVADIEMVVLPGFAAPERFVF